MRDSDRDLQVAASDSVVGDRQNNSFEDLRLERIAERKVRRWR
jgi:hypothetical protein